MMLRLDAKQAEFNSPAYDQPRVRSRKEVFQPHLPVRLPCYDLAQSPVLPVDAPCGYVLQALPAPMA